MKSSKDMAEGIAESIATSMAEEVKIVEDADKKDDFKEFKKDGR